MAKQRRQKHDGLTMQERHALLHVKINKAIEDHGVFIMCVGAGQNAPGFAYSIGLLDTFDFPEIIMFGLSYENMGAFINSIVDKLREGTRYEAGQSYTGLANLPVYFGRVDDRYIDEYFGQGQVHHKRDLFPAMQMVWSDTEGRFPWERGFTERMRKAQPLLFQIGE